jgi:hypothetical protein
MWNIVLTLLLATAFTARAEQPPANLLLVRISENWTTLHATLGPNNFSNCITVRPDGRIDLELLRQEFFDGRAVLTTYESALDSKEIENLKSILNDADVKALQPFTSPVLPMDVDDWQAFQADVTRGTQVQQVGYLTWHGHGPNNSEGDKTAWKQSEKALQRLAEWSHTAKSSKALNWRRIQNPHSFCGR